MTRTVLAKDIKKGMCFHGVEATRDAEAHSVAGSVPFVWFHTQAAPTLILPADMPVEVEDPVYVLTQRAKAAEAEVERLTAEVEVWTKRAWDTAAERDQLKGEPISRPVLAKDIKEGMRFLGRTVGSDARDDGAGLVTFWIETAPANRWLTLLADMPVEAEVERRRAGHDGAYELETARGWQRWAKA